MMMAMMLALAVLGAPPTVADYAAIKPLPKLTVPWPAPTYDPADAVHIELTRILGAVSVHPDFTTKAETLKALAIAKLAETKRGSPIKLGVPFLPWRTAVTPDSAEASAEFYTTYRKWRVIQSALNESTYKPGVVCLVDTETFDARTEPALSQVADLYSAYDAFIRAIAKCEEVYWYAFAKSPAPAEPDEWAFHPWAVPFDGQRSIGFELYYVGEIGLQREASRRAKAQAGALETTAWVSAPGSGWRFTFDPVYQVWSWDNPNDVRYSGELGRELYGSWQCARPQRFMACPSTVVLYPHPNDPRLVDPDKKHLMAFLKAAVE